MACVLHMYEHLLSFLYFTANCIKKKTILVTAVFQNSNQYSLRLTSLPSGSLCILHSWTNHIGGQMQRSVLLSPCESCNEHENSYIIHSMHLEIMSGCNWLNIE